MRIYGTNGVSSVMITEVSYGSRVRYQVSGAADGTFDDVDAAKRAVARYCRKGNHRWLWTVEKQNGESQ